MQIDSTAQSLTRNNPNDVPNSPYIESTASRLARKNKSQQQESVPAVEAPAPPPAGFSR